MIADTRRPPSARSVVRTLVRRTCPLFPDWYSDQLARQVDRQLRAGAVHEPDLLGLEAVLPPRPLILDVGAHHGQSVISFKALRPEARIVSFEPNPGARQQLERIASRFTDVTIRPMGLGRHAGSVELVFPVVRRIAFQQLASLHPLPVDELVDLLHRDGFVWARPAHVTWERTTIEIGTLDDLGIAPDLIKIDVEGAECEVLDGGAGTLRGRPVLVVERGCRPEVRQRLDPLGYLAQEWDGSRFVPATGRALDTYFFPLGHSGGPGFRPQVLGR